MRPLNPKTNEFQKIKKLKKNDQNLYLIFMGVLIFLGLSLSLMEVFSHTSLSLPNLFGQVIHF